MIDPNERYFKVVLSERQHAIVERLLDHALDRGAETADEEWAINGPSDEDYAAMRGAKAALNDTEEVRQMDPNANLQEQLELARAIMKKADTIAAAGINVTPSNGERLAELVLALDQWRDTGGFDPYDPHGANLRAEIVRQIRSSESGADLMQFICATLNITDEEIGRG